MTVVMTLIMMIIMITTLKPATTMKLSTKTAR